MALKERKLKLLIKKSKDNKRVDPIRVILTRIIGKYNATADAIGYSTSFENLKKSSYHRYKTQISKIPFAY